MMTFAKVSLLALGLILGFLTGPSAKEINQRQHLEPGRHAMVNKVIASGRKKREFDTTNFGRITNEGCGDLNIGPAESDSKRPPREVIIVARDIINVNYNC